MLLMRQLARSTALAPFALLGCAQVHQPAEAYAGAEEAAAPATERDLAPPPSFLADAAAEGAAAPGSVMAPAIVDRGAPLDAGPAFPAPSLDAATFAFGGQRRLGCPSERPPADGGARSKGPIPDEAFRTPGGMGVRFELIPDFIPALARDGGIAGYVDKYELFCTFAFDGQLVYDEALERVVGRMVPGRGFVPLAADGREVSL